MTDNEISIIKTNVNISLSDRIADVFSLDVCKNAKSRVPNTFLKSESNKKVIESFMFSKCLNEPCHFYEAGYNFLWHTPTSTVGIAYGSRKYM